MRLSLILLFISAALPVTVQAQEPRTDYAAAKEIIGYNRATKQPIAAMNFSLPYALYDANSDTAHNLVLVLRKLTGDRFSGKGSLVSLNPETGKVNWEKGIARFAIRFTKDLILYNNDERTNVMNKYTGVFMHSSPYDFNLVDYVGNKGLTYGGTYMDLVNNTVLWQEKMSLETGPLQAVYLSDTTMLIASAGLHFLNTNTGKGWHYKMATSKENLAPVIMGAVVGGLFGVAGAVAGSALVTAFPGNFSSLASGLSSNMVYDTTGGVVYYSAVKSTVALTTEGRELWKSKLRSQESSKSYMWRQGSNLLLLNLGYTAAGGIPVQQGTPFMASYNMKTGDTAYNTVLGKTGYVSSFSTIGEQTLMKIGHGLYLYNNVTGQLVQGKELERKPDLRNPLQITDGKTWYFISADSTVQSLSSLNSGSFFSSDTGSIYRLNGDLSRGGQWLLSELWQAELIYQDLLFLRNGARVAIVTGNDIRAIITAKGKLLIIDDKLLISDREQLTVVPLAVMSKK